MRSWRRDRRRAGVLVLITLLHAAGLWHWATSRPVRPAAAPAAAVSVRLLPQRRPAPPARIVQAPGRPAAATPPRRPPPAPALIAAPEPPRHEAAAAAPAAPPAASLAAEPAVLDAEATARAIREVARAPGLGARAGRVGPAERAPDQRLGEGIAQGARGDCLKGEYLGAGMGLLSVPFLAAAVLRDACRH